MCSNHTISNWRPVIFGFCLLFSQISAGTDSVAELLTNGKTHLQQGQYFLALDDLQSAQAIATAAAEKAQAVGLLGLTHYYMRHYEQAEVLLRQAMDSGVSDAIDRARWTATLADIQANRGHNDDAKRLYAAALNLAEHTPDLSAGIRLGLAALASLEQKLDELQPIYDGLDASIDPVVRARLYINLGTQALSLEAAGVKLAYNCFTQARQLLSDQQPRILAEALSGLAQLYENQQRYGEALGLNRQAIQAVQGMDAHDLLLEMEWRQARLYRQQQQIPDALAAYQRSVEHIEAIRQDIPVEYHNGRSSFRDTLEPVYLGLADLLLQQASQLNGESKTQTLRRARETIERIKQSELEDFLGGRCGVHNNQNALLEAVEPSTAILYPILLADRLELLVSSAKEIQQFTQPIKAHTLQNLAQRLARNLRIGKTDAKPIAQQLYRWLIAPAEPWLRQHQIQTLVMVPDGVLRLIPVSALYDGKHYLIENYAIATSPGLSLIEPAPIQQRGIHALLAGMSSPGAVIEQLQPSFLRDLADNSTSGEDSQTRRIDAELLTREPVLRQKIKEQLSLPGVAQEMDNLQQQMPNTLLMNQNFTVNNFKQQLEDQPYSVVHIASHGVFGKSADSSFIMAYDDVININQLEQLFKSDKFNQQPVEMLTMSACQTAEGDDRAPMGLSGVALKAKVRSALGTLWPVSDEAAALLMAEFYKALAQPGTSKAQALQHAQITLLKQDRLNHPFYWSPFILVGNWL